MSKRVLFLLFLITVCIVGISGCERVSRDNSFTQKISIANEPEETVTEEKGEGSQDSEASTESDDQGEASEDTDRKQYQGRYDAVGLYLNDYYVQDEMSDGWYLVLNDDGTGYMYFGEDNQGEISDWTMNGESLMLKAGVSVFEGKSSIKNGILLLDFDNDMIIAFCTSEVDPTSLNIVSAEEYTKMTGNK